MSYLKSRVTAILTALRNEMMAPTISTIDPVIPQIVDAVVKTIADPSPLMIIEDVKKAIGLVLQLKQELKGMHPSVMDVVKMLL